MELTASELWSRILEEVRTGLPEQAYQTWLSQTAPSALSEGKLLVEAPSLFHVEWLEDKYGPALQEAARKVLGRSLSISFTAVDNPDSPSFPAPEITPTLTTPEPVRDRQAFSPSSHRPGLNARYVFDRFVVGGDNQLAWAASTAVAARPALTYNPLFLYGGVGLGKTHLMHAIGNAILAEHPDRRVAYVPSEQFTNDLVTSIQRGTMAEFRRRYRQMDLLLVDDVHFLKGKERTQEEFFHTFNALHDAQKQIVLTSDRPPKDIPGLEERLISRFEWGLVADIKAPDYETRVAILRKKASDDGLVMDPEVMDFVALSCTSSVRELEGAIIKLLAYSSLTNQEITISLAEKALKGMFGDKENGQNALSPERIREVVAAEFGVSPEALASKRRTKDLTVPRQIAMYLIRELLNLPLMAIGAVFGGRDHSTVIHSINKVERGLDTDPGLRNSVDKIRTSLSRSP